MKWQVMYGSILLILAACGQNNEPSGVQAKTPDSTSILVVKQVIGIANVEPLSKVLPLSAEISGIVRTIYVQENQTALQDELVIELENAVEKAQTEQARSKMVTQQSTIRAAGAHLESLKVQLEKRPAYQRTQPKYAQGRRHNSTKCR